MAKRKPVGKGIGALERKSLRTRYTLPSKLLMELQMRVVSDGYGLRGKSKWVCEAVIDLFTDNSWLDQFDADMQTGNDTSDIVTLTREAKDAMEHHLPDIAREFPWHESPQSSIIRTAIIRRMHGLSAKTLPKLTPSLFDDEDAG